MPRHEVLVEEGNAYTDDHRDGVVDGARLAKPSGENTPDVANTNSGKGRADVALVRPGVDGA